MTLVEKHSGLVSMNYMVRTFMRASRNVVAWCTAGSGSATRRKRASNVQLKWGSKKSSRDTCALTPDAHGPRHRHTTGGLSTSSQHQHLQGSVLP